MGKKKRQKASLDAEAKVFDSPFAGLQSLRSELPPAEPTPPLAREDASGASRDDDRGAVRRRIVLQREKKGRAGKTVTRLRGIASSEERERLLKQLKKELGCGAVLEEEDIVLLGDVGARAKERLEASGFSRVVLGN